MKLSIRSLMLALAIFTIAAAAFAQEPQEPQAPEDSNPIVSPIGHQSPSRFTETHLWFGGSTLNGRSDFWDDNFKNFDASRGKLSGLTFGGDLIKHLDLHNALMLSGSFGLTSINEPARNVLDDSGNPLEHHLDVTTISLTAGYLLYPAGTQHRLIPYLGGGAGLYAGQLNGYRSSYMDNCDDDGNNCTTEYTDSNTSTFSTFGYFAVAGLEVQVTPNVTLLVDGRYTEAQANLGGDFKDHSHLDLSGEQITAGVAIRF
jgi:opacity protein-like surface antigen